MMYLQPLLITYLQDLIVVTIFAKNLILLFQVSVLFIMVKILYIPYLEYYDTGKHYGDIISMITRIQAASFDKCPTQYICHTFTDPILRIGFNLQIFTNALLCIGFKLLVLLNALLRIAVKLKL